MPTSSESLWRTVTIINELGLHARVAGMLMKVADKARDNVWLEFDGETADAKQIIDILTLGAAMGDQVTIRIEQAADKDILKRLVALFEEGFGE